MIERVKANNMSTVICKSYITVIILEQCVAFGQ